MFWIESQSKKLKHLKYLIVETPLYLFLYIQLVFWFYTNWTLYPQPILESKGVCAIFQKKGKKRAKKSKTFENLSKNVQNLKIFWKRAAIIACNKRLE